MDFTIKELFKEINKKCDWHCNGYIKCAIDEIDKVFENIEINDLFYNEFYKLKRNKGIRDLIFNSILIGIVTAVIVSLAFEAEKILGITGLIIFLIFGMLVCICVVVKNYPTKQHSVLEPYILKKMEKLIEEKKTNKD